MIVVKVRDRDIKAAPMGPVTTGSEGLPVRWYFDEAWDDLTKIAVFRVGETYGPDMAILEDVCIVPNQLLVQDNAGENLWIGVYGRDLNGEIAVPTIWTYIRIEDGAVPQTVDPAEPTPEWPQQVQNAADEALRVAHGVRQDADDGKFDGYSPVVTLSEIPHGHRVNITDKEHQEEGQSFDVMDGASAYEQAVAGGYEGTEAEFAEDLAGFSEKAQTAADAAAAAAQSAESAADSASTATTKAGEAADSAGLAESAKSTAQEAAQSALNESWNATQQASYAGAARQAAEMAQHLSQEAKGKAEDAQSAAEDARDAAAASATAAAGSATAAADSAAAAASSATAAGNAQTAAEDAQEAAETAQAAAESARDTAISALQTESATQQAAIQQKGEETLASIPEDYTDLTEDVSDLKSAVDNNAELSFLGGKISCGWEKGTYGFSNGNKWDVQTRIRTKSYIDKSIKFITADSAHAEFGVLAYDNDGVFRGTWNGSSLGTVTAWLTSVDINDIYALGNYNIKLSVRDKVNTSAEIGLEYADYLTCSTNIGQETLLVKSDILKSFSGQALVNSTGDLSDFNNAIINRYYSINTTNIPNQPIAEKGQLVYFGREGGNSVPKSGREFQVFISNSGEICYRWNRFSTGAPWSNWEKISSFPSFSMFQSFGIIGDSFASGEIYNSTTGTHADYFELSWGQILARLSGNTCVNYSTGGLSSKTWLTNSNGLAKLNAENANNLYIIALGINDANTLGSDKLGTIADIESDSTDSFYSYYGRIVRAIKTHAPTAVIMLSTLARTGTNCDIYSDAVREIGQYYSFPVLDLNLSNFFRTEFFIDNQISNHPTAITYSAMAKEYKNLIEKALEENANLYRGYTG